MKKTRNTLKINDIITFSQKINVGNVWWGPESIEKTDFGNPQKVFGIEKDSILFEEPDYTGDGFWIVTFEELERVGILDKENNKQMKVGDKFKITEEKNVNYALGYYPKEWSNGNLPVENYIITKITKTQVYFDYLEENFQDKTNWFIFKKKVFDTLPIQWLNEEDNRITGYKQLKDSLNTLAGTVFGLDGVAKEIKAPTAGVTGKLAVSLDKLKDTEWFEPIFEEEFKEGNFIYITELPNGIQKDDCFSVGNVYKLGGPYFSEKGWDLAVEKDDKGEANAWNKVKFRKATPQEIAEYEESHKSKKVVVSNNSIELTVNKNGEITSPKGDFTISEVKAIYNNFASGYELGPWTVKVANEQERFLKIGCDAEGFKASLRDLANVINTYESLQ